MATPRRTLGEATPDLARHPQKDQEDGDARTRLRREARGGKTREAPCTGKSCEATGESTWPRGRRDPDEAHDDRWSNFCAAES